MHRSLVIALAAACAQPPESAPQVVAKASVAERSASPSEPAAVLEAPPLPQPLAEVSMTLYPRARLERSEQHLSYDQKSVVVPAFEIDDQPVGRVQFDACVEAGACRPRRECGKTDAVTCVDMFEAEAYCAWVGKTLPDQDQWERAKKTWERTRLSEWVRTKPCMPDHEHCDGASWTVDGLREPMPSAFPGGLSMPHLPVHEHHETLGFRCARPAAAKKKPAEPHRGPCWASCDGCEGKPNGVVELRHVTRHKTVLAIEVTGKPRKIRASTPSELLAASTPIARDPHGRVVAADDADGRHYFTYDAAGNVLSRVHGTEHWHYHYGCWSTQASSKLAKDVVACPRAATDPIVAPNAEFPRCIASKHGRWDLRFADVHAVACDPSNAPPDQDCPELLVKGGWALRYTPTDGTPTETPLAAFELDMGDVIERLPLTAFDYDGDGHEEVVIRELTGAYEEPDLETVAWTYRDGTIVPYSGADGILVDDVKDIDRDGRPDLLARDDLGIPPSGVLGDACSGGLTTVHRSLPDGSFALYDPATREHLAAQCPIETALLDRSRELDGEVYRRLACLWIRGSSKAELERRLSAELTRTNCDADLGCACEPESYTTFVREHLDPVAAGLLAIP